MAIPPHVNSVGAFEAKTHLAQLLDRVAKGEVIVITRHGTPVARLVGMEPQDDRRRVDAAIDRLARFRAAAPLPSGVTIEELIEDGRS